MVFLFIGVFVLFENIDISRESGVVIGIINGGMLICAIVSSVEVAWVPIKSKLLL